MQGIDISQWQGDINFRVMRSAAIEYVIVKAGGSNSGTYTDRKYNSFVDAARAAGMCIGHYWFNGLGDPTADANYFVNNLRNYAPGDVLVLDVESEGSMPHWGANRVLAFLTQVKARLGVVPVVYMSSSVTWAEDWSVVVAFGSKLWVAQYGMNDGVPGSVPSVGYWPDWTIWQFTSLGRRSGYSGNLDVNTSKIPVNEIHGATAEPKKPEENDVKYFNVIDGSRANIGEISFEPISKETHGDWADTYAAVSSQYYEGQDIPQVHFDVLRQSALNRRAAFLAEVTAITTGVDPAALTATVKQAIADALADDKVNSDTIDVAALVKAGIDELSKRLSE